VFRRSPPGQASHASQNGPGVRYSEPVLQEPNLEEPLLGVFSKVVQGQTVKTRLRSVLSVAEAQRFHVSSLADTLETALQAESPCVLFLHGGEDGVALEDLRRRLDRIGWSAGLWSSIEIRPQRGENLGERLEGAFRFLCHAGDAPVPALIVGSDSPHLPPAMLRGALDVLRGEPSSLQVATAAGTSPGTDEGAGPLGSGAGASRTAPDLVLGPTSDGGYWAIGMRRHHEGLLQGVRWSTEHALADTLARGRAFGLRTLLLPQWTDVDRPEDLSALQSHLQELRRLGDTRTAQHCEGFFRSREPDRDR